MVQRLCFVSNVGITIISHPFGNGLYQLSMVTWGMVYYCYTHISGYSCFLMAMTGAVGCSFMVMSSERCLFMSIDEYYWWLLMLLREFEKGSVILNIVIFFGHVIDHRGYSGFCWWYRVLSCRASQNNLAKIEVVSGYDWSFSISKVHSLSPMCVMFASPVGVRSKQGELSVSSHHVLKRWTCTDRPMIPSGELI